MRLCVVGNSHVAALLNACRGDRTVPSRPGGANGVSGWPPIPATGPDGMEIDAYAIPGGYGPSLVLDGLRVRPRDRGARVETNVPGAAEQGLDLSVYDQVLFSAIGLPAVRNAFQHHPLVAQAHAGWWRGHVAPSPADVSKLADSALAAISPLPVSQTVLALALAGAMRPMHGLRALCDLARAMPGRVTAQPVPLPVRRVLRQSDCPLSDIYGDDVGTVLAWSWQVQQAELRRLLSEQGLAVRLLPLPDNGWLASGFSPDEYADGDDGWHLHADYGRLVLDQWLGLGAGINA